MHFALTSHMLDSLFHKPTRLAVGSPFRIEFHLSEIFMFHNPTLSVIRPDVIQGLRINRSDLPFPTPAPGGGGGGGDGG